jgi:hypothetical protein
MTRCLESGAVYLGFCIFTDTLIAVMSCYLLRRKQNEFVQ